MSDLNDYLSKVKEHSWAFKQIPDKMKTAKLCLDAVQLNPQVLEYVSENMKTHELCLSAVKGFGRMLRCVPEKLKTAELCLVAVNEEGLALESVPKKLKTAELCLAAVKKNGSALDYVPNDLKTVEVCLAAVKKDGSALYYVPNDLKTIEVCLAAVKKQIKAMKFVPAELQVKIQEELDKSPQKGKTNKLDIKGLEEELFSEYDFDNAETKIINTVFKKLSTMSDEQIQKIHDEFTDFHLEIILDTAGLDDSLIRELLVDKLLEEKPEYADIEDDDFDEIIDKHVKKMKRSEKKNAIMQKLLDKFGTERIIHDENTWGQTIDTALEKTAKKNGLSWQIVRLLHQKMII